MPRNKSPKELKDRFIRAGRQKHGSLYNYSKVDYIGKKSGDKVIVICKVHGPFEVAYGSHRLFGCRKCASLGTPPKTTEELRLRFIANGREVHDNRYDYSKVDYEGKNARGKVIVICKVHGPFQTDHQIHITMACNCPKCSQARNNKRKQHSAEQLRKKFIRDASRIHDNYYDYSKVSYKGKMAKDKVCIICPRYGEFWQTYGNHVTLQHRHPKDHIDRLKQKFQDSYEERLENFLRRVQKFHKGEYTYPNLETEFKEGNQITVICPKCGPFKQFAYNHANGHGCIKCKRSALERSADHYIKKLIPHCEIIANSRKIIPPYELDFYIPDHKLAIEVGSYYYHSGDDKHYHARKQKMCEALGIDLVTIFDTDLIANKRLIKGMLASRLGKTPIKVAARKTTVVKVGLDESRKFQKDNHVQGYSPAHVNLGLTMDDELVALLTLGTPRFSKHYQWEIIRYCTKQGVSVQGGFSKLFAAFVRNYNPSSVVTYANLRWGSGRMYEHAGFSFVRRTSPAAWYTGPHSGGLWLHRMKVQKHRLEKLLKFFDPELTAEKNLEVNHWKRVYDCGNNVYVWHKNPEME